MAISVADNFSYLGTKPLDARISFDTVSAMASASEATLYDGCFAYVKATQKYYSYDSTNTSDPTTGKWREYSSGGGGGTSDYSDLTNKPSINGVELLGNKVIGLLSTNIQVNSDKIGYDNTISGMLATNVKNALDELKSSIVDSYTNLSNKPSINGEELLGNKTIGLLSGNIQVDSDKIGYNNTVSGLTATNVKAALDELANGSGGTSNYQDLTNKPSINGVELLGDKVVGLLSTNIQINANKIGYSGDISGASTVQTALNYLQETFDDFEEEAASAEIRLNCWTGFTSGTILVVEGPDEIQRLTLGSEAYIDFKVTHCGKYDIHVGGSSGTVIGSIKVNALGYKYAMPIFNDGDSNYAIVTVKTSDQNLVGKLCTVRIASMVAAKFIFDEELSYTFKTNYTGQQHTIECTEMSATATVTPENYGTNYDVSIATANPLIYPHVTASTTDITAGTTALPTNDIYLVYE